MKMIIVRHGEAEKDSPTGRDKDRVLTEKGVHDIKKMAEFIKKTPLKINYIFYSPYKRTEMTAEIFANEFGVTQIQPSDKLLPSEDYGEICNDLNHFSNSDTVLIVGHSPDVSYFCSKLIGTGSCSSSCFPAFAFSPGTSVAMNIAKENFIKGQIIWILSPDYILNEPTNSF
ncbi:MAG: phosphohistidine phosphatase SixA [Leptospiraceae bacterium]|nr:phosphohistidine phosphatase SixA [Leptospiraceae bacterium]MCK6381475.1 phosphohistidine phosphatase SixA [Leptospiraceae bacterium]NUM40190.1 phosphohistidine phosphatase SixA [Leptospiraceae bacterium]